MWSFKITEKSEREFLVTFYKKTIIESKDLYYVRAKNAKIARLLFLAFWWRKEAIRTIRQETKNTTHDINICEAEFLPYTEKRMIEKNKITPQFKHVLDSLIKEAKKRNII